MGRLSLLRFLKDQFTNLEIVSSDLTGKTVIITGANIGLGLETAKHFARMNPKKLILACRDITRAEEAAKQIREETNIGEELMVWHLDLSIFESVVKFVNKFESEGGGSLDLLVENAAIATENYQKTGDGWERTIQINHLSTALLAILLLPTQMKTLSSGKTPRLVIVSSEAHYLVDAPDGHSDPKALELFNSETYCTPARMNRRYHVSKLLSVFLTRSLTANLQSPTPTPLTIVSVNPGFCHSAIVREAQGLLKFSIMFAKFLFARTSEMGSRTIVWAALGGENTAVHGRYLESCRVAEESDWCLGEEGQAMQDNVWRETIDILKKVDSRVEGIVTQYLTPSA